MAITADYYVNPVNGSDSNAGTSTGAAFATLQKGVDSASAGDVIAITGTETLSSAVSFTSSNQGATSAGKNRIVGVNSSWENDGTQAILDADSAVASCISVNDSDFWSLENIKLTGATGDGIEFITGYSYGWVFNNVWSYGNAIGFDGTYSRNALFIRCQASSNTTSGIKGFVYPIFICCSAHNNSGYGFDTGYMASAVLLDCVSYSNTNHNYYGDYYHPKLINCIGYASAVDNWRLTGDTATVVGSRIIGAVSGKYGIKTDNHLINILASYFQQAAGTDFDTSAYLLDVIVDGTSLNTFGGSDTDYGCNDPTATPPDFNLTSSATGRNIEIELP